MNFKEIPIKFEKGEVITSLYHSPFDYNLLYLICLAKTGLRVRFVLDDIDNIGINRNDKASVYAFKEKYFLSKTERTNIRPLSLLVPKHLLANLAYPSLKELDSWVGILNLKNKLRYKDTVEHWIQSITHQLGVYSIIGPDKSFAFAQVDDNFVEAIRSAKGHINTILSKFTTRSNRAIEFVNWLLDENIKPGITISDYYYDILKKIIKRFGLGENVWIERMSDIPIHEKNRLALEDFKNDITLQHLYAKAIAIDGKKDSGNFPFYAVSRKDGCRLLPIENYINNPIEYLVAPKVLMLNNFKNLVLPFHAINKANIHARELMYTHGKIHSNQVFCNEKWLEWLMSFNLTINLDQAETYIYGKTQINFSSFSELIRQGEMIFKEGDDAEERYKGWVASSTFKAIAESKYPLIFLALLQDEIFYKKIPDFYKLIIEQS